MNDVIEQLATMNDVIEQLDALGINDEDLDLNAPDPNDVKATLILVEESTNSNAPM